jgi:hypothetical protein
MNWWAGYITPAVNSNGSDPMSEPVAKIEELSDLSDLEKVVAGMDKSLSQEQVVRNRHGIVTGTVSNGQRYDRYGRFRGTIG